MARTKHIAQLDTWHISHTEYNDAGQLINVIDAIVIGEDNAVWMGAAIAAAPPLNTVYAAVGADGSGLAGVWNSGGRYGYYATNADSSLAYVPNPAIDATADGETDDVYGDDALFGRIAHEPRPPSDTEPDGADDLTRWLDEQFNRK